MKQKILASFLAIMLFATLSSVCFADGYMFDMTPSSDVNSVNKGDSFEVTFYVNGITHANGLLGLNAKAFYDPSHLQLESVVGVFPSEWESEGFMAYSEEDENGKKAVDIIMFYDGNKIDTISTARDDNTFGIEFKFTVITSSAIDTRISIPQGETLMGTSGIGSGASFESIAGLGGEYTLSLNKPASESSEDVSNGDLSSNDTEQSQESNVSSSENSSVISSTSDENVSSITSGDSSEEMPTSKDESGSSASSEENSDDEEKKGINIILLLVIACVAVSAIAVVVYVVKNKKDDMNPVNPG